jgi:hypothetical protein
VWARANEVGFDIRVHVSVVNVEYAVGVCVNVE